MHNILRRDSNLRHGNLRQSHRIQHRSSQTGNPSRRFFIVSLRSVDEKSDFLELEHVRPGWAIRFNSYSDAGLLLRQVNSVQDHLLGPCAKASPEAALESWISTSDQGAPVRS